MTDQEIIDYIRLLLGSISEEALPDLVIQTFLSMEKVRQDVVNYPERMPLVIYNTLVACVRWLVMQEVASGESSITERMEKIGDETISVKGGSSYQNWKDFLDWLLLNPDYVDPSLNAVKSYVIIGGVRQDEFRRVKNDPNSKSLYDVGGIIPQTGIPCIPRRYPGNFPSYSPRW
ncbi:hypothetical protein Hena1_01460 [Erwinia phage Hena1]|uniref:Uncharacterized protein n=1 Tax=Erwinia phage Hena1 TaxID=2678601 RepID=A0A6B9JB95_9CAUD|nr:hypothetical protein HWC84_gp218 [Erwinia phage Hena1]QGZ16296.1 hypothetical protein Hena1_01460 [Erwinia phage Hena1]